MQNNKIRASIAHKCRKCLVDYLLNGQDSSFSGSALMGTLIHNGFIPYYEKIIGKRIVYREKELENEYFTGHIDGYIKTDKKIFELKTVNSFKFQKIKEPIDYHITQVHIYMQIMNLKEAHIVYLNRDNGEHKSFDVKFNPLIYKAVEDKAKSAIELAKNGVDPNTIILDEFEYCDEYCKFKTPVFEKLPEGEVTSDKVDGIVELYEKRMKLDADIKDLTQEKKEVEEKIKELMLKSQAKKIVDLGINWVESERKTFDSKKFKAKHPELYDEFIKVSKTQYLKFNKGA